MSSFDRPHHFFLFEMRSGRRKLAYGTDPEDALATLRLRLGDAEMAEILPDRVVRITQRELQRWVPELG